MTVQAIGEQGLLKRLQSFCPVDLVGDDAAVLTTQPGRSLVVTTDVLVDGVHFSNQTTSSEDAGWRAAAANLSDLAAMGATPLGLTVGLSLPGDTAVDWVEGLYRGLTACLSPYKTPIVGGDICRSPVLSVAITAFGEVEPNRIMRRSAARPGDAIVVTGVHGASKAGLEILLQPELGRSLNADDRAILIQAHQRPQPRLDVVELLGELSQETAIDQQRKGDVRKAQSPPSLPLTPYPSPLTRIASMDSSDGLADAVLQLCRASGVGARLERSQIPFPPALTPWVGIEQALDWALYGGEDFELVLCLPLLKAQALVQQLGKGAAIVGITTTAPGVWLVDKTQTVPEQQLTLEQGFQHFGAV
ncbi:thiamine-phosphate kinase [Stenomitos frigidus]|uniref:thiamine-phosphate kinase n=1 Tax=Stenomitos frigidus TaxID=1886765 RepID=UPI001FEB12C0|nr:thiamine-phosphate kinase [Stenomitos frigidus]